MAVPRSTFPGADAYARVTYRLEVLVLTYSQLRAKRFLKQWSTTALKSRLEPLRKFVRTIRKHVDNILTFTDSRLTNATAKGLNRIIGMVRNRASGFRTVDAFIDLIYLTIGDVDISLPVTLVRSPIWAMIYAVLP